MDAVTGPSGWRIHQSKGDREGTWTISVSGNWSLVSEEICNLNLENYH
jgi:proteic killer suppression protein